MHADILVFVDLLSRVRSTFREIHLLLERDSRFRDVTTALIPFTGVDSISSSKRTSLSFAIDADLSTWHDVNRKAVSVSLIIGHFQDKWHLTREHGWSGQEIGFEAVDSRDTAYLTPDALMADLERAAILLKNEFTAFLKTVPENGKTGSGKTGSGSEVSPRFP